ncbi:MAG TPA: hypothetical protein VN948_04935 [Terriglobales bacterium]|nr:hypothetical protein [Terriglobales bacterium]
MSGKSHPEAPPIAGKPAKIVWIGTGIALAVASLVVAYVEYSGAGSSSTIQIYSPKSLASRGIVYGSALGAVFASFCILFGIHFLRTGDPNNARLWGANVKTWKAVLLVPWILLPPLWFCTEYFYVYTPLPITVKDVASDEYKDEVEKRKEHFEEFLHGQDNASKVWLAMVTVMAGLYLGGSVKESE